MSFHLAAEWWVVGLALTLATGNPWWFAAGVLVSLLAWATDPDA